MNSYQTSRRKQHSFSIFFDSRSRAKGAKVQRCKGAKVQRASFWHSLLVATDGATIVSGFDPKSNPAIHSAAGFFKTGSSAFQTVAATFS